MSAELLLTKQGAWTADDLALLPDDGRRYEVVDGSLLVSPPPTNFHQGLAFELALLLRQHQPPGYRTLSPGSVDLGPHHLRQPDIVLVAAGAVSSAGPLAASPSEVLLAVEVMSPGSVTEDRITKPAVYAAAGIPHFWRLEADEPGLRLLIHREAGGVYRESARFAGNDVVEVTQPVALRFRLADLLG